MFNPGPLVVIPVLTTILTTVFVSIATLQSAPAREPQSVEVEGTEFKVTLSDGRILRSLELVGTILTIGTSDVPMRLRIDAVERDPDAKSQPVWLHSLSTEAPDGTFHNAAKLGRTAGGRVFRSRFGRAPTARSNRRSRAHSSSSAPPALAVNACALVICRGPARRRARFTMLVCVWCGPITAARARGRRATAR
jgi:hypothetical protein